MILTRTRATALAPVLVATLVSAPLLAAPGNALPKTRQPSAATAGRFAAAAPYQLRNGVTQPAYSYANAIRESVWVLAPDRDGDGQQDRVAVDIMRPAELEGTGTRVPVIMDASPYYSCCGRGNESELKKYDAEGNPTKFPLFYDNYFVPRGYAYAAVDMAGTNRSTGCVDEGAASDIDSVRAVVDWMNGRATAVDANGNPVTADWTNGKVGMIGKSYDGTIANGVAATGVEGLETIVPVSAISSWYDYTRYQGLPFYHDYASWLSSYVEGDRTEQVNCDQVNARMAAEDGDESGAYTPFWSARDYREQPVPDASHVHASVFIAHGLQDTNVKTGNFSRWWKVLGDAGVERKMLLTRLGHVDPFDSERERWVSTLHRWFDHELMGIDNGILEESRVDVEVRPNTWVSSQSWPVRAGLTTLRPHSDGSLATGGPETAAAAFSNDPQQSEAVAVTDGPNDSRLLFRTPPLSADTRIGGASRVRLDVTTEVPTGQVGVALVDYGAAQRVLANGDGALTLATESCYGESTAADDACYQDVTRRLGVTPLQVLARGWSRADGAGRHQLTVELTADDSVVLAGHRLGLVVVGASPDWLTTVDHSTSTYRVRLAGTSLRLPGNLRFNAGERRHGQVPQVTELTRGTLPPVRQHPQLPD